MQKTKDPIVEVLKFSDKQLSKSLLKPYLDPLIWNNNVGYLPGSMMKFRQNKLGMLELWNDEVHSHPNGLESSTKSSVKEEKSTRASGSTDVKSTGGGDVSKKRELTRNCLRSPINTSSYGRKRKRKIIDGEVVCFPAKTRRDRYDRDSSKLKSMNFHWPDYLKAIDAISIPAKLFVDIGLPSSSTSSASTVITTAATTDAATTTAAADNNSVSSIDLNNIAFTQKQPNAPQFKVSQKLEGVDPSNESLFCVLTVAEVISQQRLRLHFDGYPDQFDFWTVANSQLIFPAGWCQQTGRLLQPPKDYLESGSFVWSEYLAKSKSEAVPFECFSVLKPKNNDEKDRTSLQRNQKLEAVDKRNGCMICVATIRDVICDQVLVHFDSWDAAYDMWAHRSSPLLQPVGHCEERERVLSVPSSFGHDLSSFNWDSYLEVTGSTPVPKSFFSDRQPWWNYLVEGMRCELVDRRCPQFLRAAHIVKVMDEFHLMMAFDDWSDKYNLKLDLSCSWLNFFPVGWCAANDCLLQPPPTYDALIETSSCSVYGCKGLGHFKGPKYSNHQRVSGCPYADCNLSKDIRAERMGPGHLVATIPASSVTVSVSTNNRNTIPNSDNNLFPIPASTNHVTSIPTSTNHVISIPTSTNHVTSTPVSINRLSAIPVCTNHVTVTENQVTICNQTHTDHNQTTFQISTNHCSIAPTSVVMATTLLPPLTVEIPVTEGDNSCCFRGNDNHREQGDDQQWLPMDLSMKPAPLELIGTETDQSDQPPVSLTSQQASLPPPPLSASVVTDVANGVASSGGHEDEIDDNSASGVDINTDCLSNKQQEDILLEDSELFANPPGDFMPPRPEHYPPCLSLHGLREHLLLDQHQQPQPPQQRFFHQYRPPRDLIPNPVAIVPASVLRPCSSRPPYHPSDEYRRIMEWNIMEQIMPQLGPIKRAVAAPAAVPSATAAVVGGGRKRPRKRTGMCQQRTAASVIKKDEDRENNLEKASDSILHWDCSRVSELVSNMIGSDQYARAFIDQEVDGAAFLCLKQMDLMRVLGMRLGPAIKVATSIQYLRRFASSPHYSGTEVTS